jgi:hydrogenase maturation protease
MSGDVVVIGIGNSYRRDDGVGPAVAAAVDARAVPGFRVLSDAGDPCRILDAWADARLAVVVDGAVATPSVPGRIHRCTINQLQGLSAVSSHGVDIATVLALGAALDRMPADVVVFAIEVTETGYGVGLSPRVAAAIPHAVAAVMSEVSRRSFARRDRAEMPWPRVIR